MLDLCKCDMMEELNEELTGDVCLVAGKVFDSDEDGRGGNDKGIEGVNLRCQEESNSEGLRVGRGHVERFVTGRGQEVGHREGKVMVERQ